MQEDWKIQGQCICREFKFANFREAMSFMFMIAFEAEQMDHHPDWKNVYNKVLIELTTHDKGCVSDKDYALAAKIDEIYSRYQVKTA